MDRKEFIKELLERKHSSAGDLLEATSAGDDILLAKELEFLDQD